METLSYCQLMERCLAAEARVVELAAENAALKSKGKELLGEACAVYSKLNKLIDPSIGDFVDGQTLHEFQFVLDVETPATDRIVVEAEVSGVEKFAKYIALYNSDAEWHAVNFAKQLRAEAEHGN